MKKIGIIKFHNGSNYGAALQCFALQEAVKKTQYNVTIINYSNRFIMKGLDKFRFEFTLHGCYYTLIDILYYKANNGKINKFKQFFEKYYNLTKPYSYEQLKNGNLEYDIGISGSDQIWNPLLNKGVDDIYFLEFPSFKKKISYGSSFGSYKFDINAVNKEIQILLSHYSSVTVRENAEKINEIFDLEVCDVCDPTWLLDKEEWKNKLSIKTFKSNYLLIYAMTDFDYVIKCAKKIADRRNLEIVYIGNALVKRRNIKYVVNAGPKEFVELFYNANYIVTNSFHGTAFSLNFCKQFVSLRNPKNPERAEFLLNSINMLDRMDYDENIIKDDINETRYSKVINQIDIIRRESLNVLLSMI